MSKKRQKEKCKNKVQQKTKTVLIDDELSPMFCSIHFETEEEVESTFWKC